MKNGKRRKLIVPVIITGLVLVYLLVYAFLLVSLLQPLVLKILLGAVPVLLGAVMIGVCIQRIREIQGGEEDDLSDY